MLEQANKPPSKRLARRPGAFGSAARGRMRDRAQSSARSRQPRDETMSQPNEAPSSEFLADDPSEDSAVRMSSGFAPASEAPAADAAYFDSTPPQANESRDSTRPAAHEDMAGDSTLSRYFREMA